jgi:hypothetical protein
LSKGTPHRPIRIDADLWAKAQAKAAQEGTTASAKARDLLAEWVDDEESFPARLSRMSMEAMEKQWRDER